MTSRRRRKLRDVMFVRVGPGDKAYIRRVVSLCQVLDSNVRAGDVLIQALSNLDRSVRVQIRTKGLDPVGILAARELAEAESPAEPFDGAPDKRSYVHERKRGTPFKGVPKKPEARSLPNMAISPHSKHIDTSPASGTCSSPP